MLPTDRPRGGAGFLPLCRPLPPGNQATRGRTQRMCLRVIRFAQLLQRPGSRSLACHPGKHGPVSGPWPDAILECAAVVCAVVSRRTGRGSLVAGVRSETSPSTRDLAEATAESLATPSRRDLFGSATSALWESRSGVLVEPPLRATTREVWRGMPLVGRQSSIDR